MDNANNDMMQWLVRFLDGELSGDEKSRVEERIKSDDQWKEAYGSLLETRTAIRQYGLQETIAKVHREFAGKEATVRSIGSVRRTLRAALSVAAAVLLVAVGYFAYTFYSLSPNKLYTEYYRNYTLPVLRGDSLQIDTIENYFRQKQWKEVTVFAKGRTDRKSNFIAGLAQLEMGNPDKAIENFLRVRESNLGDSLVEWKDETEFYLALAYIRNRDYDLAIPLLQQIRADKDHSYHDQVSAKLIRQIKMLKWR